MAGNPNWAKEARVYSRMKEPEEAQEPEKSIVSPYIRKGLFAGGFGGGIEAVLEIIPELNKIPYCAKEEIIYRLMIGAMTAALLIPIPKEKEKIEKYWTKALCSGGGYAITTLIIYGGLEMITKIYEKI